MFPTRRLKGNLKFLRCEKGTGTIISTLMFLIISGLFVGGTFLWQAKSQGDMNTLDGNRIDETFLAEATFSYDPLTETYTPSVKVTNTGPIDLTLVGVYVIDETNNDHQHIGISYYLSVDDSTYISEIEELIDGLSNPFDLTTTTYYFKIVSERGNIAISRLMHRDEIDDKPRRTAIIIPDASYVKRAHGKGADIHLEVWNPQDEAIHITLIVATRMEHGAEHSEIIHVDWILSPRLISIGDFKGEETQIYKKGELCFIELVDITGNVVSSYYFICQ